MIFYCVDLHLSSMAPPAGGIFCYSTLYNVSLSNLHFLFIDHYVVFHFMQQITFKF